MQTIANFTPKELKLLQENLSDKYVLFDRLGGILGAWPEKHPANEAVKLPENRKKAACICRNGAVLSWMSAVYDRDRKAVCKVLRQLFPKEPEPVVTQPFVPPARTKVVIEIDSDEEQEETAEEETEEIVSPSVPEPVQPTPREVPMPSEGSSGVIEALVQHEKTEREKRPAMPSIEPTPSAAAQSPSCQCEDKSKKCTGIAVTKGMCTPCRKRYVSQQYYLNLKRVPDEQPVPVQKEAPPIIQATAQTTVARPNVQPDIVQDAPASWEAIHEALHNFGCLVGTVMKDEMLSAEQKEALHLAQIIGLPTLRMLAERISTTKE